MAHPFRLPRAFLPLLILSLLLPACTRFHGLKPLEPDVGRPARYAKVRSLTPELRWEAAPGKEAAYDLVICPAEEATVWAGYTGKPGQAVYYREGLEKPSHHVETPLEPGRKYLWSVRVREGGEVSAWSTYEYMYGGRIGEQYLEKNMPYRFRTPKRPAEEE